MPTYSMRDLMMQPFGSATNAQQSHQDLQGGEDSIVGRRRKRPSDQTKKLIKEFMSKENRPVTMLEICDHLRRRPGPHLRAYMREMVDAGEIVQDHDYGAGPLIPRFLYTLA